MKEKRSLFKLFFGDKKQKTEITTTQLKMLNTYNPFFSTIDKDIYNSKVARECIDRIATYCAKLVPKHIKGNISNHINGQINFMLQNGPNPLDTKYDFIYKIISRLYSDSNAFVYIAKDKEGMITGFYPVQALNYNLLEDSSGKIYLKFRFVNGQEYIIPYLELIHLRLFYNKNDVFGTNNKPLYTDLETAVTASEGMKNAIKTTGNLKGILKYTNSMLKEKDLKKNKDSFVNDYLNLENQSGIAALDGKADFQEIKTSPITLDGEQWKRVNYNIFDYFGINEKIINNSYTPDEWNAFYEGVIEARAIQLSDAFTVKIFSRQARKEGHKIVFTANRLQYASLDQKIKLLNTILPYGVLTKDDTLEMLDMTPIGGEEGSKILQSLNNINSKIADDYQGGNDNGKEN